MTFLLRIVSCVLLITAGSQACLADAAQSREALELMFGTDQALRSEIRSVSQRLGDDALEVKALWQRQEQLDQANIKALVEIVELSGWPKISLVGEKAATAAFAVLQHADISFQKRYLPLLRAEAALGEVKLSSLALLEDRVLVTEGQPQKYGSQLRRNPKTGKIEFFPIADEVNVNARRKSVGLEPLEKYAKRFGLLYIPVGNG